MSAPGSKVRLRAPGEEASPRLDRVTEPGPAPGSRRPRPRQRTYPGPAGHSGSGHPPQHRERDCPASPRAALGLPKLPKGRRLLPAAGRTWAEAAGSRRSQARRPQAETAAAPAVREGRALPAGRRRKRREEPAGPAPGPPCGAEPGLTVPPSLMMIFLASMILRFAARFFFFPWVILPSSTPGAVAATQGAGGPSGECGPATTAGPSRSGRTPPS